jgi:hypothetical protein
MMTKADLLRHIAETGYNVGYGAKKHFATYDLVQKAPAVIGSLTFTVGLYFLLIDFAAKKYFSAACLVLGAIGMRVGVWDSKKEDYAVAGRDLTGLFNKVKALYLRAKAAEADDLSAFEAQLEALQAEYNGMCLSNQIVFSDWYAHYKFFWQQQIGWIDEQLRFRLFRDKLPLTFTAFVAVLTIGCAVAVLLNFCWT